jgi:hypothetical protein
MVVAEEAEVRFVGEGIVRIVAPRDEELVLVERPDGGMQLIALAPVIVAERISGVTGHNLAVA